MNRIIPFAALLALLWAGSAAATIQPAEGVWYNPSRPGNGVTIDRQGDRLVVAIYTFDADGSPIWALAAARYEGQEEISFDLHTFAGGTPIQESSFGDADMSGDHTLTVRFHADVYAEISVDGREPEPIVPLLFGGRLIGDFAVEPVPGVSYLLADFAANWLLFPHDLTFPLRNILVRGTLMYLEPAWPDHPLRGRIPKVFHLGTDEESGINCEGDISDRVLPGCYLPVFSGVFPAFLPEAWNILTFPMENIAFSRMRGAVVSTDDGLVSAEEYDDPVVRHWGATAYRVGNLSHDLVDFDANSEDHWFSAATGLWWREDRPGSGLYFEQRGWTLVLIVYTFDEDGRQQWLIGSGQMESPRRFVGELGEYGGGLPLGDRTDLPATPEQLSTRSVSIEFAGTDHALMQIGDSEPFAIRSFNVAHAESIAEAESDSAVAKFPDLTGLWVFSSVDPDRVRLMTVEFGASARQDDGISFSAVVDRSVAASFACRTATQQCALMLDGSSEALFEVDFESIGKARLLVEPAGDDAAMWGFRVRVD